MNFSVVVIAKNEAETLPRLVASLKEFQNQDGRIIVVDTGSTDQTVEIAEQLGCTVIEEGDRFVCSVTSARAKAINRLFIVNNEEPIVAGGSEFFDYSEARNYAASLAMNDMVWMPDCDEEFTTLDLGAVQKA